MPDLETFPMAHQVTYKYYVGVISFLEENYAEVSQNARHAVTTATNVAPSVRKASDRSLAALPQRCETQ